jgi:DNA-binding transcriptional LysR family regulator
MDRFSDLETFVAVVEAGGFSPAAERLGVAKSAVSRRVSALEQRLGARLLNRTTRRISLTDAGRALHARARTILADLDEAEQSVAAAHRELRGRLKIAAPLSFGLLHLQPAIDDFLTRHPAVQIELDLNDREVDLIEEGVDMAVRIGELADSSLVARRLAPIRRVAVASPAYLASRGTPRHPNDLAAHQGLRYTNIRRRDAWTFLDPRGRAVRPEVPERLRANNGEALAAAAADGLGIAILPTFTVHRAVERGELVVILRDWRLTAPGLHLVYPPGRFMSRRVRAFSESLAERFGECPYWDRYLDGSAPD